jgi:shikimate dehydrogenase
VADIVTKPEMTPLLSIAEKTGHRVHTGKYMHMGQARLAAKFLGFESI